MGFQRWEFAINKLPPAHFKTLFSRWPHTVLLILDDRNNLVNSLSFKTLTSEAVKSLNLDSLATSGLNLLAEKMLNALVIVVQSTHLLGEVTGIFPGNILLTQSTKRNVICLAVTKNSEEILNDITVSTNRLLEDIYVIHCVRELDDITLTHSVSCECDTRKLQVLKVLNLVYRTSVSTRNCRKILNLFHSKNY